jgi:adenylate kinase
MAGRRVHLDSGRTYHLVYNPPKQEGLDDLTGEPLIQRDDDHENIVRDRLATYHEQTSPLVNFYSKASESTPLKFDTIAGVGSVQDITARMFAVLDR